MLKNKAGGRLAIVLGIAFLAAPALAGGEAGDPPARPTSVSALKRQIDALRLQSDEQRKRFETQMDQQRKLIEALQQRLDQIQNHNQQAEAAGQQQVKETNEQLQTLQQQVKAGPSETSLSELLEEYDGEHRFVITGGAAATFSYDRERNNNTFGLTFEPIFLFRPATWLLFEAEPSFDLPASGGSDVGLEYAQADIFATDNLQIVVGKFLLPFGDFPEDLHPF